MSCGCPRTAEARNQSQASPCGIYGGQCDTGTGFSPGTSFSAATIMHPRVPMRRMACTEPQCLYKSALYLYLCTVEKKTSRKNLTTPQSPLTPATSKLQQFYATRCFLSSLSLSSCSGRIRFDSCSRGFCRFQSIHSLFLIYLYISCMSRGRHVSASLILGHLQVHRSLCSLQCQV